MGELKSMIGQRVGRLRVISQAPSRGGRAHWRCICDCGEETVAAGKNLRTQNTKSCGCLMLESSKALGANRDYIEKRSQSLIKHGHKRRGQVSPEYRTWLGIKRRCTDKKFKDYAKYGGQGIIVSLEWASSFEAFLSDMGKRPSPKHQIDRINSTGPYSKENCRWVTPFVQGSENKSNLKAITVRGVSFPSISAAARHFGIKKTAVHYRLKSGVPIDDAFSPNRMKPR